jgi:hypothetical protein
MKRGFLDLLDPSNDPEFFWQVISGPPCIHILLIFEQKQVRWEISKDNLFRMDDSRRKL